MGLRAKALESLSPGNFLKENPEIADAASKNVGNVSKVVDMPITAEEQDEVRTSVKNPAKMEEIQKKPAEQQTISDKFALAIAAFAPTVLGTLFGGAEAGAAAAQGTISGATAGLNAAKTLQEIDLAPKEVKVKELKAESEAQRANTASDALDFRIAEAPKKHAEHAEKINESRLNREQRKMLSDRGFDDKQMKETKLSDTQAKDLGSSLVTLKSINEIGEADITETGPIKGRVNDFLQKWGVEVDPKFTDIKSRLGYLSAAYGKMISGTAMSDQERKNLLSFQPKAVDDPKAFAKEVEIFKREVQRNLDIKLDSIDAADPERLPATTRYRNMIQEINTPAKQVNKPNLSNAEKRAKIQAWKKKNQSKKVE